MGLRFLLLGLFGSGFRVAGLWGFEILKGHSYLEGDTAEEVAGYVGGWLGG